MSRLKVWLYAVVATLAAFAPAGVAMAATTVGNNVSVGGTLTVTGNTTLTGSATGSSYVSIGTIDGSNLNYAAGSLNVGNRLSVDGATYVSSTLDVTSNARFYADVTVDGNVSSSAVTSSRHVSVGVIDGSNANYALGSLNVGNRLSVDGATYVSSTLDVASNARFYADVTIDGNVSSSAVTSSRHVSVGVIDGSNANYALGSLNVGNRLSVDGATYVSGTLDVANDTKFFGNITVSSTDLVFVNLTSTLRVSNTSTMNQIVIPSGQGRWLQVDGSVNSTLRPSSAQGNFNLGAFNADNGNTAAAWRDLFVSSTVYAGTTSVHNTSDTTTIFAKSGATGKGGRLILEDSSGSACVELFFHPVLGMASSSVTCPPL